MNELARMANSRRVAEGRRNQAYLFMTIAGLFVGALVYLVYEQSTNQRSDKPNTAEVAAPDKNSAPEPSKSPKATRPRLVQKAPEPPTQADPATPPKKKAGANEPIKASPDTAKNEEINRQRAKSAADEKVRVERLERAEKAARRNPPPPPISKVSTQTPEPRPTDNISQGQGPIAKAIELAGRIQTIGPLNFSIAALDACSSKCTLSFKDSSGASIKAVFFKNAYIDQLKSRSKSVFLTGNTRVDRGELTLFIQDVR